MKKHGFTLVELMGVITVLGLITLLVAPTIINQIRNSKDKIDSVTEKLIYAAADLYLDNKENDYPRYNGSTYCLTLKDLVEDGKLGSPVLDSNGNEISLEQVIMVDVNNRQYSYRITNTCESVEGRKGLLELATTFPTLGVDSIDKCAYSGLCDAGTAFAIKVNEEQVYKFYVLKDDGNTVTLMMDRNLGDKLAWYSDDDDSTNNELNNLGPITALNYLNTQTSDWDNIYEITDYIYNNNLNGTTYTYGYQSLNVHNGVATLKSQDGKITNTINGITRARLLTYEEITSLRKSNGNIVPAYLYDNLSITNTPSLPFGYWLLTSDPTNDRGSRDVSHSGDISAYYHVYYVMDNGIRPVIEIPK